ncbi:helix-turn-helix transcriptional regulator [Streptomyces mayteni]
MHIRTVSPVFVGRASERALLTEVLSLAAAGEPQAVLIGGEAGVGKSRLVDEFLAEARAAGAVTAEGACVEVGAEGLPFAPVSTVLRALNRQLGEELAEAAAGFGGELGRLLPELGGPTPAARAGRDEDERARLFELTARLLEALGAERTLVLVIEDLHWSDRSTRGLLDYLFRSLHHCRVVLLITYRSDDIHRRHPLRPFLAELDRQRTVRRVELDRFTREEVRGQLAGIRGAAPSDRELDQVYLRSDGNAFFVEELATANDCGGPGSLSDSVRDLLLVRVEALPETAQRVVRTLAEGGSKVEHGLLRAVTKLGEDELIEALRAAVGATILRADGDDTYRFRHALVREAVDDDLLPGERSRLSRRFAEALEAEPELVRIDERPARLASYWYHARDAAQALPAILGAAATARCRHAYAEQLHLLERALEVWDEAPPGVRKSLPLAADVESYPLCDCDDEELSFLDLLAEMTVAARRAGEPERGLAVVNRAMRHMGEREHPLRAAWFWTQKSRLVRNLAKGNGWPELGTAQKLLEGFAPSPVHAHVMTEAAGWRTVFDPRPEGVAVADRAVELSRQVGDEESELNALISRGGLLGEGGRGEEGVAVLREAARRAEEAELVSVHKRGYVNLGSMLEAVGRSEEAVEVADHALPVAYRYGLRDTESWLHGNRSDSLFSLGRWAECEAAILESRRTAQTPVSFAIAAKRLALLAIARGDLAAAESELERMTEYFNAFDVSAPQYAHPVATARIGFAAQQGRILDARRLLAETLAVGLAPGVGRYTWPMLDAAAVAESESRGVPAAGPGQAAAISRIRECAASLPGFYQVWRAYALMVEAELRRAEGTAGPADWAAAAAAFDGLPRPRERARISLRWAETLLAEGERDQAAELLAEAHAEAERLGAAPLLAEAERLAQRGRLPLSPDEDACRPDSFGLTRRELDVLALVAAGRTNRQIAEELFISPKTASVHVSNILAKLEVSGRGQAAALAHRLGLVGT